MRARLLPILKCLALVLWVLSGGLSVAQNVGLQAASAITYDAAGNLYIADGLGHRIWEATLAGTLLAVAGTGVQGFAGDGGPATNAELNGPLGIAVAADGTLWIADTGNNRLRRVGQDGVIRTVAGTGESGYGGDGAAATAAMLRRPTALATEASGGMLVCDTGNQRVRSIVSGVISTLIGSGIQGSDGDTTVLAKLAKLNDPLGVAVDAQGDVFVADSHNHRVRRLGADGMFAPYAGTGVPGFTGDGAPALAAQLAFPQGLAALPDGSVLIADTGNQRLREISGAGVISTVAGSGVEGSASDGGSQAASSLSSPRAAAVTSFGLPVLADTRSRAVRVVVGGQTLYLPAALAHGRTSRITASASPAVYGESSVHVSVSGLVGVPQGNVGVTDAATDVASAALNAANADVFASALHAGSHTLQVSYSGDGLNPADTTSVAATVEPRPVVATAASATIEYGAVLPLLSGDVSGILPQDAGLVQATFTAGVKSDPAPAGVYTISATLTGQNSSDYTISMAPVSGLLTVARAVSVLSTEGLSGYTGLPVMLTAVFQMPSGGSPTGTVLFSEDGVVVASAPVTTGQAQASWTSMQTGVHHVLASYTGDQNFLPSAPVSATITLAALPDFQLASATGGVATLTSGTAVDIPFTVSSLGGPFTGAVNFSVSGLPSGTRASFSPPAVVPGAVTTTVMMHIETSAPATAGGAWIGGSRVRWAGLLLVGCIFMRRRRVTLGCALLAFTPMLSGCGARSVGAVIAPQSTTYSLVLTGTGTDLAGRSVTRTIPLALTVKS